MAKEKKKHVQFIDRDEEIISLIEELIADHDQKGQPVPEGVSGDNSLVKNLYERLCAVVGPEHAKMRMAFLLFNTLDDPAKEELTYDKRMFQAALEYLVSEKEREASKKNLVHTDLPQETEELLRVYFDAFCNLYAIIPLSKAYRIIEKQNPDLGLTKEDFISFADGISQENHFYIIAGEEDIYEDVDVPTPPMERELIAEYLYSVDDFESYEELKEQQGDKPYYIPDKEELVRYQDEMYNEETKQSLALLDFLKKKLKVKNLDDIMQDLQIGARMGDHDIGYILETIEGIEGKTCFHSEKQVEQFSQYYFAMYNHTRMHANRGFTPTEVRERTKGYGMPRSIEIGPNLANMLQTGEMDSNKFRQGIFASSLPSELKRSMLKDLERVEQKKPGRNDPCPCGSGKKYKHCCGR